MNNNIDWLKERKWKSTKNQWDTSVRLSSRKLLTFICLWLISTTVIAGFGDKYNNAHFTLANPALHCLQGLAKGDNHYACDPRALNCKKQHLVCKDCVDDYMKSHALKERSSLVTCSVCSEFSPARASNNADATEQEIFQPSYKLSTAPPSWFESELNSQQVFCGNAKYGCNWQGAFSQLERHQAECAKKSIKCETCKRSYLHEYSERHQQTHSEQVDCELCGVSVPEHELDNHFRFHCQAVGVQPLWKQITDGTIEVESLPYPHALAHSVRSYFQLNQVMPLMKVGSVPMRRELPLCENCQQATRKSRQNATTETIAENLPCPGCFHPMRKKHTETLPDDMHQSAVLLKIAQARSGGRLNDITARFTSALEVDRGLYYWRYTADGKSVGTYLNNLDRGRVILTLHQTGQTSRSLDVKCETRQVSHMDSQILLISDSLEGGNRISHRITIGATPDKPIEKHEILPDFSFDPAVVVQISDRGEISQSPWQKKQLQGEIINWSIPDASQQFLFLEELGWPFEDVIQSHEFVSGGNRMRLSITRKEQSPWLGLRIDYSPEDKEKGIQDTLYSVVLRYGGESWHIYHQNRDKAVSVNISGGMNWLVLGDLMRTSTDDKLDISLYPLFTDLSYKNNSLELKVSPQSFLMPEGITQSGMLLNDFIQSETVMVGGQPFDAAIRADAYTRQVPYAAWSWNPEKQDLDKMLNQGDDGFTLLPNNGICQIRKNHAIPRSRQDTYIEKIDVPPFTIEPLLGGQTVGKFVQGVNTAPHSESEHDGMTQLLVHNKGDDVEVLTQQMTDLTTDENEEEDTAL
ncbi:hypothetical protein [Parendozoicomonas haliclonae]|uniref:Uncharacterized protein n=1 Tax=Parendozoicomonas haliclonae TaxID=1960125 RepID=A0A1X7AM30_9GAMM|nr:hypothetical protein [Parendozoicomonas haliclonae]SMA46950.1 hypothetical protein EHSB41UT_02257 [Parendozoicomonas haliclonae]